MMKILTYEQAKQEQIFVRSAAESNVSDIVTDIITQVRKKGDQALYEYAEKFDKAVLSTLEVSQEELDDSLNQIDPELRRVLTQAAENIRAFHSLQVRSLIRTEKENGVVLGQKITPIEKVGLYVPGGTASYPSTVLMNAVPAQIAGCKEIVMVSPPSRGGKIAPVILAAAKLAGVSRVFTVGGAQAVAALAYGTETVPKVDKIVGPGNAFVAEAKKQVFGTVNIDMIAGPSEILVVADGTCRPEFVAADLLSQAEHDKMASAVLVTDSLDLAKAVQTEVEKQLAVLPREEIARVSIDQNGKIIVASDLKAAVDIANEWAPEHLEICVDHPFDFLDQVKHAGSVFLGKYCPEALGDYLAGPNHTLPTSGTARFSSPLSVDDFIKKTQFMYYTQEALSEVSEDIARFARSEGLEAHARSATIRFKEDN